MNSKILFFIILFSANWSFASDEIMPAPVVDTINIDFLDRNTGEISTVDYLLNFTVSGAIKRSTKGMINTLSQDDIGDYELSLETYNSDIRIKDISLTARDVKISGIFNGTSDIRISMGKISYKRLSNLIQDNIIEKDKAIVSINFGLQVDSKQFSIPGAGGLKWFYNLNVQAGLPVYEVGAGVGLSYKKAHVSAKTNYTDALSYEDLPFEQTTNRYEIGYVLSDSATKRLTLAVYYEEEDVKLNSKNVDETHSGINLNINHGILD